MIRSGDQDRNKVVDEEFRMSGIFMRKVAVSAAAAVMLAGCVLISLRIHVADKPLSFTRISQEEAREMMEKDDGHVIVDVRREDEYASGHIPGAICIPNETIYKDQPEELPDLDQVILVYCRSGNRSKRAARMLYEMGYTQVYEFGGIIDWTGEIVTDETETELTQAVMRLSIGETEVPVTWEENASVDELKQLLPLTISMTRYGGFEQVGPIGQSIVSDDVQTTTDYGDIVLYSGNQLVIFYGSNSWVYTRLGHVELSQDEMTDLLGTDDVIVTITEQE